LHAARWPYAASIDGRGRRGFFFLRGAPGTDGRCKASSGRLLSLQPLDRSSASNSTRQAWRIAARGSVVADDIGEAAAVLDLICLIWFMSAWWVDPQPGAHSPPLRTCHGCFSPSQDQIEGVRSDVSIMNDICVTVEAGLSLGRGTLHGRVCHSVVCESAAHAGTHTGLAAANFQHLPKPPSCPPPSSPSTLLAARCSPPALWSAPTPSAPSMTP
jgi:hypothetical protein